MADMISMKMDPKELQEQTMPSEGKVDMPVYPYGLTVRLDEKALDKLGMDTLPAVGKTLVLTAHVDVTEVSDNKHQTTGESKVHRHRNVSLQITELALEPKVAKKDAAASLYNGDKAE
jgi:hypothetical protein